MIWALGLRSDLDDQENQTAQAQQQAAQASKEVETCRARSIRSARA
jgi:hypothetical protein